MVKLVHSKKSLTRYIWALSKHSAIVFRVLAFHLAGVGRAGGQSLLSENQLCLLPRETASLRNVPPASQTMTATVTCRPCPPYRFNTVKIAGAAQSSTDTMSTVADVEGAPWQWGNAIKDQGPFSSPM